MFIAALFIITKKVEKHQGWMKWYTKCGIPVSSEYYPTTERNEVRYMLQYIDEPWTHAQWKKPNTRATYCVIPYK